MNIKLTKNYYALIDDEDFDILKDYKWKAVKNKDRIYAVAYIKDVSVNYKKYRRVWMHRLIMGVDGIDYKTCMVDHINHDCLNNTKNNLRIVTNRQNQLNQRPHKDSLTGLKNIYWRESRKRYEIRALVNGKRIYLGFAKTKEKAIEIYNNKIKLHYGEFAYKIEGTK